MGTVIGTITYENLVIKAEVTDGGTLIAGQDLVAGAVLGKITASGKLQLCDSTAADGSEAPFAILLEDSDATAADLEVPILLAGVVNEGALSFGGTDTADTDRAALRDGGIFLKTVVGA